MQNIDYPYLYETHLHTLCGSRCGQETPEDMAASAKEAGYAGIFVTEHNWKSPVTLINANLPWEKKVELLAEGYRRALRWGEANGLDVFFGYESCYQGTEFMIYGVLPEWLSEHPEIENAGIEEQYEIIKSGGGMVIQAHPFRAADYIPEIRLFPQYTDGAEVFNATHSSHLSTVHNESDWNDEALRYARKNGLKMTAGSDVHRKTMLMGGVLTRTPLKSEKDFVDLVLGKGDYILSDGERCYDRHGNPI